MDTGTEAGEPASGLLMLPPGLLESMESVGDKGEPAPADDKCGKRTAFCWQTWRKSMFSSFSLDTIDSR